MKVAAVSELKAKLAQYLRLVKAGEKVEIQERGIPIAILSSASQLGASAPTIPPRKDPERLGTFRFSVKLEPEVDVLEILMQDRRKR